jgi:hypothetical protein
VKNYLLLQIHVIAGLRNSKKRKIQHNTKTPKDFSSSEEGSSALRPNLNTSNREKTRSILGVGVDCWQGVAHGSKNGNLKTRSNPCHTRPQELQKTVHYRNPKGFVFFRRRICSTDSFWRRILQSPVLKDPGSIFLRRRTAVAFFEFMPQQASRTPKRKDTNP